MTGARAKRWWQVALGAAFVAAGGYAVLSRVAPERASAAARGTAAAASIPVVAAHARVGDMGVYLTGLGTVTPLKTVTVRTQVDGQLVTVAYKEGQLVRAKELLAQIDPRPFQVQLEQAEGQAAKDAAALKNARVDLKRYQVLVEQAAVPKQQLDTQNATVQQLEATLQSDQAQIASARLNLTYARITSPLTGRIGLRLVDPGNIVHTTDQNGLAVITQRQPIAVVFTIPQDNLPDVQRQLNAGRRLAVDAYDRDLRTTLGCGILSALDSQIDPTTGTIKLKATFANEDEALFPNQFVNARLLVNTIQHAIIVPSAAIQRGPQKTFVYVVTAGQHRRFARRRGVDDGRRSVRRSHWPCRRRGCRDGWRRSAAAWRHSQRPVRGSQGNERQPVNPSRPFILRPVATSLIMVGLLLAGAVAFRQLPVSALPEVDYPTIQIATFYPGASPEVTATAITAPLERQFGQMPGLNQMTSSSSDGASLITLQFVLDLDIDVAEQEVQAAINAAGTFLPPDLPNPPIYSKTNPADAPILTLALTSTTLPLSAVEDLADTRLALRLSQLAGCRPRHH